MFVCLFMQFEIVTLDDNHPFSGPVRLLKLVF